MNIIEMIWLPIKTKTSPFYERTAETASGKMLTTALRKQLIQFE
ncbi:MAG: hypothetical protein ACI35P_10990 [Bacillus sp. (in: firmicutes)]